MKRRNDDRAPKPTLSSLAPWEVLEERVVYSAGPWFSVLHQRVRLPNGRVIEGYHQVRMPRTVIILPYTPDRRILMLRNYKHGFGRVCLTFPGGILEDGESPLAGAKRELREETGYTAPRWEFLGSFIPHANYGCGRSHLFIARDARPDQPPQSGDLEDIRVELLARSQVIAALNRGEIVSLTAAAILGLSCSKILRARQTSEPPRSS